MNDLLSPLELDRRAGLWTVHIDEPHGEGDFGWIGVQRVPVDEERVSWQATRSPDQLPFFRAKAVAQEYAGHVATVQESWMRDAVYVVSVHDGERVLVEHAA